MIYQKDELHTDTSNIRLKRDQRLKLTGIHKRK